MSPSVSSPSLFVSCSRPRKLDDVAHQEEVVQTLRRTLQSGNLPHLLFYGPPGTGKTSTILAMARELYGPDLMKKRVLELNASNERGIDVIRHKVKEFAQIAVGARDSVPGYPCPPFKIIILDEADSMTKDAQSALRRTMEQYTKVTRFAIICNYVSRSALRSRVRHATEDVCAASVGVAVSHSVPTLILFLPDSIIEPITSRCAKFRYKPLSGESMIGRLRTIAEAEKITLQDEVRKLDCTRMCAYGRCRLHLLICFSFCSPRCSLASRPSLSWSPSVTATCAKASRCFRAHRSSVACRTI